MNTGIFQRGSPYQKTAWTALRIGIPSITLILFCLTLQIASGQSHQADRGQLFPRPNITLSPDTGSTAEDNWAYFPSGTSQTLRTVTYWNPDTGIVAGDNGVVLRTLNGGRSWTPVDSFTDAAGAKLLTVENHNTSRSNRIKKMPPPPGHECDGLLMGDNGRIFLTTNCGASWSLVPSPRSVNLRGVTNDDNYSALVFYAVGDSGTIIKTTNGGFTWFRQTSPTPNRLNTVTFYNPDTGFAAGDSGVIIRTTNGGTTWTVVPDSSFATGIRDAQGHPSSQANVRPGIAPGAGVLTYDLNPLWITTDYGADWEDYPTAAASSKGYISQKGGTGRAVGSRGTVLSTSDGWVSWTMSESRTRRNFTGVFITEVSLLMQANPPQTIQAVVVCEDGTIGLLGPPGFVVSNPGPTWCRGSSHTITWSGGSPGWSVAISLIDVNSWESYTTIAASTPNDGSQVWNIPSNVPPGMYQIFINEVGRTTWAYSSTFTISACMPAGQISLSVDSANALAGDTVDVPVRVSFPTGQSYTSAEVSFSGFQNQGLTFLRIDTAGTMIGQNGWLLAVNNTNTLLVTATAGAQSISGSGILYKLRFSVSGGSCGHVPINITRALFSTGNDTVRTGNGGVFVNAVPHYGDVDENGLIQAFDASKILQHLAHMDTLGCQGLTNANVSNDTSVSALDASLILMYVVGLINRLPYDTTVVATGNIAMVGGSGGPGDTIAVPIYLSSGGNILSFEGLITFDPSRLVFSRIQWSSSVGSFTIQSNVINGELYVAGAGTTQSGSSGLLATMYFVNQQTGGQTQITFRKLRWNEGAVRENVATATIVTGVEETEGIPVEFALSQCYPNPFNPTTTIKYQLPIKSRVTLTVYDVLGREVASLVDDVEDAGYKSVKWDASAMASGVYLCCLDAGKFTSVKKLLLMR
jgi:photosystem II stability/assembly factor-like uncharacterized protein